jgi:predicted Fe-Mo cluster-binding NifX family protein
MKIAITSNGANLDAPTSPVFGRCPMIVLVETETLQFEAIENPAIAVPSGAGIQAAQLVVERGAQAVVTGNIGPNALDVFQSAGVPIYLFNEGTVRDAVETFMAGKLQPFAVPNAQAGAGTGAGQGMGIGRRMGRGRGMGRGLGRGRGMRQGMGWSMGVGGRAAAPATPGAPPPSPVSVNSREEEIATLKETTSELQRQLDEAKRRLDELTAG